MKWLARLLAWDGVLPLVVWAIPAILTILLPDGELICLTLSIILPIAALLVRFTVGREMIAANRCSRFFRSVQLVCLCVGLFILMCLDSLLIILLSLNLPGSPDHEPAVIIVIFLMGYLPYLVFLSVAMYPGPSFEAEPDEMLTRSQTG